MIAIAGRLPELLPKTWLRHLGEGLVATATEVWAYWMVPGVSTAWMSDGELAGVTTGVATALGQLGDVECHLLSVPKPFSTETWRASAMSTRGRPAAMFESYVDTVAEHLAASGFSQRSVMLGVRLGQRGAARGWRRLARRVETVAGVDDDRMGARELTRWRARAELLTRVLAGGSLRAEVATADEIAEAVRRVFWRGIEEDPCLRAHEGTGARGGAGLEALVEGTIVNRRRYLEVGQGEQRVHVAHLALARFPDELRLPGGEWLSCYDDLDFPVEASVRFRLVPPRQARKDAQKSLAAAKDQLGHEEGAGADPSLSLVDTADSMRELDFQLQRSRSPLVYTWPRLVVTAPSLPELEARVGELRQRYADLDIEVVWPSGVQLSLFLEGLPGEHLRVRAYEQRQAVVTLAGSMFQATSDVGDDRGAYVGYTLTNRAPVLLDVLARALNREPTTLVFTGRSGSGKTNAAFLVMCQMVLEGAWVVYVDPKGDARGLTALDEVLGGVTTITLGAADAGALDPFDLADDLGAAKLLAIDTLSGLLKTVSSDEEGAIARAVAVVAAHKRPTLRAVVDALGADSDPVAHRLADRFTQLADLPMAEMAFGAGPPAEEGSAPRRVGAGLDRGLVVLQLAGLQLPEEDVPVDDYTAADRLAVVLMRLVMAYATHLADSSPALARGLFFDEAHAATRSRQGRALITRLARTGSSKNVVLGLITQNARDLLDPTIKDQISGAFCFTAHDDAEVRDVLQLLQVEATPENIGALRALNSGEEIVDGRKRRRKGECVFMDNRDRRATMRFDLVLEEFRDAFDTTPGRHIVEVLS